MQENQCKMMMENYCRGISGFKSARYLGHIFEQSVDGVNENASNNIFKLDEEEFVSLNRDCFMGLLTISDPGLPYSAK